MPANKHQSNTALATPPDGQFRNRVLEMLVDGAPLIHILETMLRGMETLLPGALCTLMLLDNEGLHIARAIGPSLPDYYTAALIGLEIGPAAGSCGTAAYTGQRVVVDGQYKLKPGVAIVEAGAARARPGASAAVSAAASAASAP